MQFQPIAIHFEDQEYVVSVEIRGNQLEGTGRIAYILYLALNELLTALSDSNGKLVEDDGLRHRSWLTLEEEKMRVC